GAVATIDAAARATASGESGREVRRLGTKANGFVSMMDGDALEMTAPWESDAFPGSKRVATSICGMGWSTTPSWSAFRQIASKLASPIVLFQKARTMSYAERGGSSSITDRTSCADFPP